MKKRLMNGSQKSTKPNSHKLAPTALFMYNIFAIIALLRFSITMA
ncbi:hypothetical protein [Helicobacter canis]|nr:hypothetical protein [Helicobacter canis]